MIRPRNRKDLSFGIFLIVVGIGGLLAIRNLNMGSILRMGPGWMPRALCFLLLLIGAALGARSFFMGEERVTAVQARPVIFTILSVVFFALGLPLLGLPLTVFGTVLLAAFGDYETRLIEALGLAVLLAVGCALIFVEGLGMTVNLLPVGLF